MHFKRMHRSVIQLYNSAVLSNSRYLAKEMPADINNPMVFTNDRKNKQRKPSMAAGTGVISADHTTPYL